MDYEKFFVPLFAKRITNRAIDLRRNFLEFEGERDEMLLIALENDEAIRNFTEAAVEL